MKTTLVFVPLLLALTLVGCSGWSNPIAKLSPHRIEVQQGNLVSQDMVARLKPGMTQSQVRFLLGTPPIVDPFHVNRWDYAYSISKGGEVLERRRLTLRFENDRLKSIEGDIVAAEASRPEVAKP